MGSSTSLEFLPADILGLSPLARAALGGELDVEGVVVARSADDIPRPTNRFEDHERTSLVGALEEAIARVSPPIAVLESIRALEAPDACAVLTGQQPGLACGPLYSLWKGLQAIALARTLSKKWGTPVVPMFWNHADDHDIAEVHHTWILNRNHDLQKVSLAGMSSGRQPFSRIVLDEEKHKLAAFETLMRQIHGDQAHLDAAVECLAPRPGETLARAFTRGMTNLLGRHGLIVFEPDWLRSDLSAALARLVGADAPAALAAGEADLTRSGHEPALPCAEAALLYHVHSDGRRALRSGGEGYQFDGEAGSRTAAELAAEITQGPDNYSAGALLRPIVQDTVLPVCATIGGWGELAYHAQLGQLRLSAGLPAAAFVPRLSITLSDPATRASLEALGRTVADTLRARGELNDDEPAPDQHPAIADLYALAEQVRQDLLARKGAVSQIDGRLSAGLERTANQLREKIRKVAEKAARVQANSSGHGRRHERRCSHALFPRGGPQERSLGPLPYIARFGTDWIKDLLRGLDAFAPEHIHCALSDPPEAP